MGLTRILSKTRNLGRLLSVPRVWRVGAATALTVVCAWALSIWPCVNAQAPASNINALPAASTAPVHPTGPTVTPNPRASNPKSSDKHDWNELSPAQQQALAPLAGDWAQLDTARRKKWLEIARRYPTMKPEEQQRTQQRMREWALLTPEQRRTARDSYVRAHALSPEKRVELLQKYQQLPEEKKRQLAAEAKAHKTVIRAKPEANHHGPIPSKAQIREGSTQRIPGLARPSEATPVTAKTPHAPTNLTPKSTPETVSPATPSAPTVISPGSGATLPTPPGTAPSPVPPNAGASAVVPVPAAATQSGAPTAPSLSPGSDTHEVKP